MSEDNKSNFKRPVFHQIDNPFSHLDNGERQKVFQQLGDDYDEQFETSLDKLTSIIKKYEPITLTSILSTYGLTTAIVPGEGVGRESALKDLQQAHIEFLQALILTINPNEIGIVAPIPEIVQQSSDLLIELAHSLHFKNIYKSKSKTEDKDKGIHALQTWVRGHTSLVRNWGYFNQVEGFSKELFSFFDQKLFSQVGYHVSDVFDIFRHISFSVQFFHNERMKRLKKLFLIENPKDLLYSYCEQIEQVLADTEAFLEKSYIRSMSILDVRAMIILHSDLALLNHFIFSPRNIADELKLDISIVPCVLESFSLKLGALIDCNIEHIFLDNPIWYKPIIKLDQDEYFCPNPQMFFSFVLKSFEKILKTENKESLSKRKSEFLEEKIKSIVNTRFPEANTVKNLKWKAGNTEYETDLITFIDSYTIIVEAKSGNITDSALRGAPERLKRHIEDILLEPNYQSKRLMDHLNRMISDPTFDNELRKKLPVQLDGIHKVIRISVTLDFFSAIHSNISNLRETGWIPNDFEPCPTMNLAEFDTVFDLLEHPVQILHYLERRTEIEGILKYHGTELDLLGWYINTLFEFGEVYDDDPRVFITELSEPIDRYYESKCEGIEIPKPSPAVSALFMNILEQLEQRKIHRWLEIGVILHRIPPEDQGKLSDMIEKHEDYVHKNWMVEGHENLIVYTPQKSSEYSLCYVMFKNQNFEKRDEFIDNAISHGLVPDHVKYCVIIAKNIDIPDLSYNYIALVNK